MLRSSVATNTAACGRWPTTVGADVGVPSLAIKMAGGARRRSQGWRGLTHSAFVAGAAEGDSNFSMALVAVATSAAAATAVQECGIEHERERKGITAAGSSRRA